MRADTLPAKIEVKQAFDELYQNNILDSQEAPEYYELPYGFTGYPDDDDESDSLFRDEEATWELDDEYD
jgi:hypothetical protein